VRAPWRSSVKMSLQVWKIGLDALADRREVGAAAGLVFAAGADDRRVEVGELGFEVLAAEVLVAIRSASGRAVATQRATICRQTSFSSTFWRSNASARGVPSRANRACSRKPQKKRLWHCAVAVVGGVGECVREARGPATLDRLPGRRTPRGGVHEQQLVIEAGAVAGELADQPSITAGQSQPALVKRAALGEGWEQVAPGACGNRQEPGIRRIPIIACAIARRDDLRVEDSSPGVPRPFGQEIVHRGNKQRSAADRGRRPSWPPRGRRSLQSTVDFDLPAYVTFPTHDTAAVDYHLDD